MELPELDGRATPTPSLLFLSPELDALVAESLWRRSDSGRGFTWGGTRMAALPRGSVQFWFGFRASPVAERTPTSRVTMRRSSLQVVKPLLSCPPSQSQGQLGGGFFPGLPAWKRACSGKQCKRRASSKSLTCVYSGWSDRLRMFRWVHAVRSRVGPGGGPPA